MIIVIITIITITVIVIVMIIIMFIMVAIHLWVVNGYEQQGVAWQMAVSAK